MPFATVALLVRKVAIFSYRDEWFFLRSIAERQLKDVRADKRFEQLEVLSNVLVIAEDRRFFNHFGFDSHAILRAIVIFFRKGKIQGGSTITQQLVRTLISDYRKTVDRKCKEILLAALLDDHFDKKDQIKIYLRVAYFGWRMNGVFQACGRLRIGIPVSADNACEIISRLKYPEPQWPSDKLRRKIADRSKHLRSLLMQAR